MSEPSTVMHDLPLKPSAAESVPVTRVMYWSIRRELWENRFLYVAPLVFAAVVLFGNAVYALAYLPRTIERISAYTAGSQHSILMRPFSLAAAAIMFSTFVAGVFYSVEALHGERRDRSIVFWKSLPVSDVTTVLAKACIPLVVLPLIAFVFSVAAQAIILLGSSAALLVRGISPAPIWREFQFVQGPLVMIYGLIVHSLWFAPLYGWMLVVSAAVRRAALLWAVLPFVALSALEKIIVDTSRLQTFFRYRLTGAIPAAFGNAQRSDAGIFDHLSQLTPWKFLKTPDLLSGLGFAALFIVAAIRLRRTRGAL